MKLSTVSKLSLVFLASTFGVLHLGATSVITITAVDYTQDSVGNYVGPYTGTVDNASMLIFCDDVFHHININEAVTVNVSTIAGGLGLTRFGGLSAATTLNATKLYEEAFYLSTFLSSPVYSANRADIQDAIWDLFVTGGPNAAQLGVLNWQTQASNNYSGKDYSSFRIYTQPTTGNNEQYDGKQELFTSSSTLGPGVTATPEPGTLAMLLTGMAGVVVARVRRRKQ